MCAAIISTNSEGTVTSFNPAAERLLGYSAAEVIGKLTPAHWRDPEEMAQHALELSIELGETISTRIGSLRPGDLLFFGNDGISIDHVAIYAGHDRIIHATASGGGVRYDVLGEGERGEWFTDHIVTARRIVAEGRARPNVGHDESRDEGELDPPDQAPRSRRSRGE